MTRSSLRRNCEPYRGAYACVYTFSVVSTLACPFNYATTLPGTPLSCDHDDYVRGMSATSPDEVPAVCTMGTHGAPARRALHRSLLDSRHLLPTTSRGRRSVADVVRKIRPRIRHYDTTTQTGPLELLQSELSAAVVLQ